MTVLALFLAMVGSADFVRYGAKDSDLGRRRLAIAVAAVVAFLGFWGLGRPAHDVWLPAVGLAIVALWAFADRIPWRSGDRVAFGGVVATVFALLAFGQHLEVSDGWLQSWYSGLVIDNLADVPFDRFALAVGCLFILQNTANLIVRLVLNGAGPGVMASAKTLKGGRILGPLERTFIFAMALSGQFAAIGAVIAAKGILRFPEISRADDDGNIAEYVLVGSFVSWVLALLFIPLF
ncbi:MAG: hypothetical protein H7288_21845 [Kineosporiaceae bacterium]|nr:hypothetical protein [Aeromicrobium sp.]